MRRFTAVVVGVGALLLSGCSGKTTGATNVTDASATLTSTARCASRETCRWYWEYWPASGPRSASVKTPVQGPVSGPVGPVNLSAKVKGLSPDTAYRWVFCGSPNDGAAYFCVGPNGTVGPTTADPPPDYDTFATAPVTTLAEAWDGTNWKILPTPNPAGATGSQLNGVSCTSPTACTAVGYYFNSAGDAVPLAERWDGSSWTIQTTPNNGADPFSGLYGVSCTSATACTAVGASVDVNVAATLGERWDGTSWTIEPTPNQNRYSQLVRGLVHLGHRLHRRRYRADRGALGRNELDDPAHPQPFGLAELPVGGVVRVGDGMHRRRGLLHIRPADPGRRLGRHHLDDPAQSQSHRRADQHPAGSVVHIGHRLHRRRKLRQPRDERDAGGALGRHELDDPDHTERPPFGARRGTFHGVMHLRDRLRGNRTTHGRQRLHAHLG